MGIRDKVRPKLAEVGVFRGRPYYRRESDGAFVYQSNPQTDEWAAEDNLKASWWTGLMNTSGFVPGALNNRRRSENVRIVKEPTTAIGKALRDAQNKLEAKKQALSQKMGTGYPQPVTQDQKDYLAKVGLPLREITPEFKKELQMGWLTRQGAPPQDTIRALMLKHPPDAQYGPSGDYLPPPPPPNSSGGMMEFDPSSLMRRILGQNARLPTSPAARTGYTGFEKPSDYGMVNAPKLSAYEGSRPITMTNPKRNVSPAGSAFGPLSQSPDYQNSAIANRTFMPDAKPMNYSMISGSQAPSPKAPPGSTGLAIAGIASGLKKAGLGSGSYPWGGMAESYDEAIRRGAGPALDAERAVRASQQARAGISTTVEDLPAISPGRTAPGKVSTPVRTTREGVVNLSFTPSPRPSASDVETTSRPETNASQRSSVYGVTRAAGLGASAKDQTADASMTLGGRPPVADVVTRRRQPNPNLLVSGLTFSDPDISTKPGAQPLKVETYYETIKTVNGPVEVLRYRTPILPPSLKPMIRKLPQVVAPMRSIPVTQAIGAARMPTDRATKITPSTPGGSTVRDSSGNSIGKTVRTSSGGSVVGTKSTTKVVSGRDSSGTRAIDRIKDKDYKQSGSSSSSSSSKNKRSSGEPW